MKVLKATGSLMKVESIAECNTFDLHQAIIGLENHLLVFLRVAVLHRVYCSGLIYFTSTHCMFNQSSHEHNE